MFWLRLCWPLDPNARIWIYQLLIAVLIFRLEGFVLGWQHQELLMMNV